MKKHHKKTGLPPGSVVFTGKRKVEETRIHYLEYNEEVFGNQEINNQTIKAFHEPNPALVQWYDMRGLHNTELIEAMGGVFKIHPLALEDIADIDQRPKLDEYDNGLFITLRALAYDKTQRKVTSEHVALFLGDGYILTFQENETDIFARIRERIIHSKGRIRRKAADYLAYTIIDAIIDDYYLVLDDFEEEINGLEQEIMNNTSEDNKGDIHALKQELMTIRRSVSPLREAISFFDRSELEFLQEDTRLYLRDTRDHAIQLLDLAETYRDLLNSLHDLYLSELSFKMNNTMQVLTIMSTIFIPLSFLSGLYGMNFEYMPELSYRNGYFILLGVMGTLVVGMLLLFKRREWF